MSDPTRTLTRRQKVEEREQAILESARRVFFEKGYEGARMSEIAAGAKIAEGTVYIYYKNKAALMRALVAAFWQKLTEDAWTQVIEIDDPRDGLIQLARFHITSLIEQSDMIDLTQSLRATTADVGTTLDELRDYVRVFDTLFGRAIDRGMLRPKTDPWIIRDVFYGALDYSARTMQLRDLDDISPVVINLVDGIWAQHGTQAPVTASNPSITASDWMTRLEDATLRMEKMLDQRDA